MAAVAYGYLVVLAGPAPLHRDTLRDFLLARDFVDGGRLLGAGPMAAWGGYYQGASWPWLIALCRAVGLGPGGVQSVVLLLHAAAVGVVFRLGRRFLPTAGAVLASALTLALSVLFVPLPLLWNPSVVLLPATCVFAAGLAISRSGAAVAFAAAGVAVGLAIDAHGGSVLLLPGLTFLTFLQRERVVRHALLAAAATTGTMALVSHEAFRHNLATAAGDGLLLGGLAGLALAAVAGHLARRRRLALFAGDRPVVTIAVIGAPLLLLVPLQFIQGALDDDGALLFAGAYRWIAGTPAAGLFVAALFGPRAERPPGGRPPFRAALASLLAVTALGSTAALHDLTGAWRHGWTLSDGARLAHHLHEAGWRYQEAYTRLQGPAQWLLISAVAAFEPAPRAGPPTPGDDWIVFRVPTLPTGPAPPGITLLPLDGGAAAVLVRARPWTDRSRVRTCFYPSDGPGEPRCLDAAVAPCALAVAAPVAFDHRPGPHLSVFHEDTADGTPPAPPGVGTRQTWEWRLTPGPDATPRDVIVLRDAVQGLCFWQIERIDGFAYEVVDTTPSTDELEPPGALPAPAVTLRPLNGAPGRLVVARSYGAPGCPLMLRHDFPPSLVELTPAQRQWLDRLPAPSRWW